MKFLWYQSSFFFLFFPDVALSLQTLVSHTKTLILFLCIKFGWLRFIYQWHIQFDNIISRYLALSYWAQVPNIICSKKYTIVWSWLVLNRLWTLTLIRLIDHCYKYQSIKHIIIIICYYFPFSLLGSCCYKNFLVPSMILWKVIMKIRHANLEKWLIK